MIVSLLYLTTVLITFLPSICLSWNFSDTNINLSYPPPLNSGYIIENDETVGPDPIFPCATVPVDPSVSRVPFPAWGGALTYNLTNNTVGSLKDYKYSLDIYVGQISLGDGTYSSSDSSLGSNYGYAYVDTEVYRNFATGQQCSSEFYAAELVNHALGTTYLNGDHLVGVNATIAARLVLLAPRLLIPGVMVDDYYQEEMYQCGYVTFGDPDPSEVDGSSDYCNLGSSVSASLTTTQGSLSSETISSIPPSTWSTLYSSSVATTGYASPSAAVTGLLSAGSSSHHLATHTIAVGIGVGVSMGASILILAIGFVCLRRRRARRARSGTIGAHILVCPASTVMKEKTKVEEKGVESSSTSVHSEPLPVYTINVKKL